MSLFGGIASAVVGGLFGKKKQTTTSTVDYERMARDASAAGFNPLTAIRNGGSAGFTTTTSPTISNTPEILSNLGGVLGNALGSKLDPIEAKKREIDTLLVDRQLRQLKEGPQVPGRLMTPRTFEGVKISRQLVPRLGATSHKQTAAVPAAYKPLNSNLKAGDDPEASNLGMDNGRYGLFNPGIIPNAGGVLSDVFGEPGEWVGGLAKVPEVGIYSIYRNGKSLYEDYSAARNREQSRSSKAKPYVPPRRLGGWMGATRPRTGGGGGW